MQQMMETNYYSVVVLTREVVKGMMARNRCGGVYGWIYTGFRALYGSEQGLFGGRA